MSPNKSSRSTVKTEILRSRELARRAKRKENNRALGSSKKAIDSTDAWYKSAYQRFSISLRASSKTNEAGDF